MTVQQELVNRRNCRSELNGVLVSSDGRDSPVESSYWDRHGVLVLLLEDGRRLPAADCDLLSRWPIACCRPKHRNAFNTENPPCRF